MLVCEVEIRKRHFDSLTSVYPARDELGTWNPILVAIFLATQSLKRPTIITQFCTILNSSRY
jgi:hypothetical protein